MLWFPGSARVRAMHGSARCLPLLAATALAGLLAAPGCTRHDFRQRADKDVEGIITQKNVFPAWQVKNWNAYPNPDARFADNSNPDRPPYPPDDYAARLLSPNPQKPTKRSGVGRVDGTGYLAVLENWDAQNRAEDPDPAARGNLASASPAPEPSAPPQTAQLPARGRLHSGRGARRSRRPRSWRASGPRCATPRPRTCPRRCAPARRPPRWSGRCSQRSRPAREDRRAGRVRAVGRRPAAHPGAGRGRSRRSGRPSPNCGPRS